MTPYQAHAFVQMQDIALPIIKAYHNDLNEHDRRTIERSEPGHVFLWAPRECGTHLITLARADGINSGAADHFKAIQSSESDTAWHVIIMKSDCATVRPVSSSEAAAHVKEVDRRSHIHGEPNFYALHM